jgi:hypothetical protein
MRVYPGLAQGNASSWTKTTLRRPTEAESGDEERFQALIDETRRAKERARVLAQGYGFKECGSGDTD